MLASAVSLCCRRAPPPTAAIAAPPTENSTEVRRHSLFAGSLASHYFPDVRTLYDAFQRGLRVNPRGRCMGTRVISADGVAGAFAWLTYEECGKRIDEVGSGIVDLRLAPTNAEGHRLVGLFAKNRREWAITEQACHAYGLVDVPLYDTLGPEAIVHILAETRLATVFADAPGVGKLLDAHAAAAAAGQRIALANIVCFDAKCASDIAAARNAKVTLWAFEDVAAAGKATPAPHAPPSPEDLAFICYTSGTTGLPKGAQILHRNEIADASCAYTSGLNLCAEDIHLSYLPLAHIFERLIETAAWTAGGAVGFFQGETAKIMDDLKALRPTVFPSVPRLFNKVHDKVLAGVDAAGGLKAALFHAGFAEKRFWLQRGNCLRHPLWDALVFAPIAKRAGLDRVRFMIVGSAPIAPHVLQFLRIVFSVPVLEGYGQTECSAAATLTSIHDHASLGHVGSPLACNEVKLVSVPEMGYDSTDVMHGDVPCRGRGEVCFRGHNVFGGYYKDPTRTAEVLDEEGWLHSGDIGVFDVQGNLRIVDRKKNIFKLSQGEYVAAEKIENVYTKSPLVAQIFVYGDSLHAVLVAIIVPDPDAATTWAQRAGGAEAQSLPLERLCALPAFKAAVAADMEKQAKEAGLQSFEKVKGVHLVPAAWTPDDLLTPSFKLKRVEAKKLYLHVIDALYEEVGDTVGGRRGVKV